MVKKIDTQMSADLDLNTLKTTESLGTLKKYVQSVTSSWKAQNAELRSAGDYMGAAQAKVDGLKNAISGQEREIDLLRQKQKDLNTNTEDGTQKYAQLETKINKVKTQMSNYSSQLTRAENSLRSYKTGIVELRQEIKQTADINKSYVDKLKAEHKQYQANRAELEHNRIAFMQYGELYKKQSAELVSYQEKLKALNTEMTNSKNKLDSMKRAGQENTSEYQAQERELSRLRGEINNTNNSISQQKVRVNETGTSMAEANNKTKELGKSVGRMSDANTILADKITNVGNKANNMGDKFMDVSRKMNIVSMGIGAGFAYGAKKAVDLQNEFKEITNLAVTSGEKQAEAQNNVNQMYKDGEKYSTQFGVSQQKLADGYKELIKRGYDSNQALGAQKSLVEAAKASGDDYNEVVHSTTATLESFGMRVKSTNGMMKNTKEVVNDMAYASDLTATDFQSMGKAMEYVGSSAHTSGVSLHETASAIGILSNNGLEADKAGTGLRKVLISLQTPSDAASKALKDIGLSTKDFVDQNGKMKSMSDIFGMLNEHTKKMSQNDKGVLFHTLFGTTGQQAGSILASNSDELKKLDDQVEKSSKKNYVESLATKNMKSYKNQMASAKENANAMAITMGSAVLPAVNEVMKAGAKTAEKFNNLSDGTKKWVTYFGLGVAAIGPLSFAIGGILKTVKAISSVVTFSMNLFGRKSKAQLAQEEYAAAIKQSNKLLEEQVALQRANNDSSSPNVKGETSLKNDVSGAASGVDELRNTKNSTKEAEELSRVEKYGSKTGKIGKIASLGVRALGAVGVGDLAYSGINLIGINDKNRGNKIGGSTGSLAGGAIGGGLGSFLGPLGTMGGGMLGSYIGEEAGKHIGPALQKSLSKNKAAHSLDKWFGNWKKTAFQNFQIDPPKMSMKKSYDALNKEAKKYYSDHQKMREKNLKQLLKTGNITKDEYNKRLADIKKQGKQANKFEKMTSEERNNMAKYYASSRQKLEKKWNKKIQDDIRKYGVGSTKVIRDENNKKEALDKQRQKFVSKMTSDEAKLHVTLNGKIKSAGNEQNKILQEMYKKRGKLSEKSLNEMVYHSQQLTKKVTEEANKRYKNVSDAAKKQYNETTGTARKQRDDTIKAAKEEFSGNDAQSKQKRDAIIKKANEQYNGVVKNAGDQKRDTVKRAEDQRNQTVNHAEQQQKDVSKQAHNQNKNVTESSAQQQGAVEQHNKGMSDSEKSFLNFMDGASTKAYNGVVWIVNHLGGNMKERKAEKYALGTGILSGFGRNPITKPTHAMLNDGYDSPETGNREMAILPNGQSFIPKEKNWEGILPAGTEVLNATETKMMLGSNKINHFDKGTGIFDSILSGAGDLVNGVKSTVNGVFSDFGKAFDFVNDILDDPKKRLEKLYPKTEYKSNNNFLKNLSSNNVLKTQKDQASNWWDSVWSEVGNIMGSGGGSGSMGEFLRYAIKNFDGRPYVYGGFDCSEMVKEALAHFGINAGRTTVAQEQSSKFSRISKDSAKSGDLVYFGTSGEDAHVGIVSDPIRGLMFNQHPPKGGISTIKQAESKDGSARYYHVKGLSSDDEKGDKKNNSGIDSFVHKQLDNNMFKWVREHLAPLAEDVDDGGVPSAAPQGSHKDWLKQAGIPESWFNGLNEIIQKESGWNPHAKNPHSDAYGIPQALPGSKMKSAGSDWHDNPITQLKWMKSYIKDRYGDLNNALKFRHAHGWYANGGFINSEQIAHVGEGNQPEVVIPLAPNKSSRAWELIGKSAARLSANDPNIGGRNVVSENDSKKIIDSVQETNNTLSTINKLLGELLGVSQNQIEAILKTSQSPLDRYKMDAQNGTIRDYQMGGTI